MELLRGGYTSPECRRVESGREAEGEEKGQHTVGQCLDTRFYSCHKPSGEKHRGGGDEEMRGETDNKGRQRLRYNRHPEPAGEGTGHRCLAELRC